jgi:membrane associated rhomboid family serine protease/Zn-finger nucleic acid-binding protein
MTSFVTTSDPGPAASPPVDAQCPACGLHRLVAVTLARASNGRWTQLDGPDPTAGEQIVLDTCPVCFGAWFDRGEFDALGDGAVDSVRLAGLDGRRSQRLCPRGHGAMYEHQLPGLINTPIECCSRCAGIWLDGEERRKLAVRTTREGQQDLKERLLRRGVIWVAQVVTQLPVEVDNPARGTPWLVYGLLGGFLLLFVAEAQGIVFYRDWAIIAGKMVRDYDDSVHTLVTHQFLHGSWYHVLFNAYFLYVFGDNIEHLFGRQRFALLFIGAGVAGGLLHVLLTHATATPVVGASGSIAGIMAAYLWSFPRAKLFQTIFFVQLKIPAWVYLGAWVGLQLVMGFFTDKVQFAWFAHLGGFLFGLGLTPLVLRWRRTQVAREVAVPAAKYAPRVAATPA